MEKLFIFFFLAFCPSVSYAVDSNKNINFTGNCSGVQYVQSIGVNGAITCGTPSGETNTFGIGGGTKTFGSTVQVTTLTATSQIIDSGSMTVTGAGGLTVTYGVTPGSVVVTGASGFITTQSSITTTGGIFATATGGINGNGSLITGLNADNISAGTLPLARGGTGGAVITFPNTGVVYSNGTNLVGDGNNLNYASGSKFFGVGLAGNTPNVAGDFAGEVRATTGYRIVGALDNTGTLFAAGPLPKLSIGNAAAWNEIDLIPGGSTTAYTFTGTGFATPATSTITVRGNAFSVGISTFVVSGGLVGILQSAPVYTLDVSGGERVTGQLIVVGSTTVQGTGGINISGGPTQLWSRTMAQVDALTPGAVGQMIFCSNCTTADVCVSTGTSVSQFRRIGTTSGCGTGN